VFGRPLALRTMSAGRGVLVFDGIAPTSGTAAMFGVWPPLGDAAPTSRLRAEGQVVRAEPSGFDIAAVFAMGSGAVTEGHRDQRRGKSRLLLRAVRNSW